MLEGDAERQAAYSAAAGDAVFVPDVRSAAHTHPGDFYAAPVSDMAAAAQIYVCYNLFGLKLQSPISNALQAHSVAFHVTIYYEVIIAYYGEKSNILSKNIEHLFANVKNRQVCHTGQTCLLLCCNCSLPKQSFTKTP